MNNNKYSNEIIRLQLIMDKAELGKRRYEEAELYDAEAQRKATNELFEMIGDLAGFIRQRFADRRDAEENKAGSDMAYLVALREGNAGRIYHLHDGDTGTCVCPPDGRQSRFRVAHNDAGNLTLYTLFLPAGGAISADALQEKEWNQAAIDEAGEGFYILNRKEAK